MNTADSPNMPFPERSTEHLSTVRLMKASRERAVADEGFVGDDFGRVDTLQQFGQLSVEELDALIYERSRVAARVPRTIWRIRKKMLATSRKSRTFSQLPNKFSRDHRSSRKTTLQHSFVLG